jgi:hypothetical protein
VVSHEYVGEESADNSTKDSGKDSDDFCKVNTNDE